MGGLNLEVFKFGMYVMFPIGWMYYFGTNLDGRFSVPAFWPTAEQAHRLPADSEEVAAEVRRIVSVQKKVVALREERRRREMAECGEVEETGEGASQQQQQQQGQQPQGEEGGKSKAGKRWWMF